MPRFTTVALNHATPSFYCPACGYMLNTKPTMHTRIWQNHQNAVDVLTQFQFDTNAHIKNTEAGLRDHSAVHEQDAAEALLTLYG